MYNRCPRCFLLTTAAKLVEVLLLSVFLSAASLEQAFRPAVAAVLIGNGLTAARRLLRFAFRKKRRLTQQQKAELMDL